MKNIIQTINDKNKKIYLDHAATTDLAVGLMENLMAHAHSHMGNPSSVHSVGQKMRGIVETARKQILQSLLPVANKLAVNPYLIFTGSGTEANNMIIRHFQHKGVIVSSNAEHASIANLLRPGHDIQVPITKNGVVNIEALTEILTTVNDISCVSIMHGNNETGAINPIGEIYKLCRQHKIPFHSDCVQSFGKVPLDLEMADYITISGHKIGGMSGIGALVMAVATHITPLIIGGGQEKRMRSGTENVFGVLSMRYAVQCFNNNDWRRVQGLRDKLEQQLNSIDNRACIAKEWDNRLPHITAIRMPGIDTQTQIINFDMKAIAVSAGSACSSGKMQDSHVIAALGMHSNDIIRISLGLTTTDRDIDVFIDEWQAMYSNNRQAA